MPCLPAALGLAGLLGLGACQSQNANSTVSPTELPFEAKVLALKKANPANLDSKLDQVYAQESGIKPVAGRTAASSPSMVLDITKFLDTANGMAIRLDAGDTLRADARPIYSGSDPILILTTFDDLAFQSTGVLNKSGLLKGRVLDWSDDYPGRGLGSAIGHVARNGAQWVYILGLAYSRYSTGPVEFKILRKGNNNTVKQQITMPVYFMCYPHRVHSGTTAQSTSLLDPTGSYQTDPALWAFPGLYGMPQAGSPYGITNAQAFYNDNNNASPSSLIADPSFNLAAPNNSMVVTYSDPRSGSGSARLTVSVP